MRIPLIVPLVLFAGIAYGQIYGGPSISGLSSVTAGKTAGSHDGYRYFGQVSGVVDTGLTPISVDSGGNLTRYGTIYGVETTFGVSGVHRTRRTEYGLAYMGGYRAYTQKQYFNGSDHSLGFDTATRVSKRWEWATNTRGATLSRPLGGWFAFGNVGSGSMMGGTVNDIFDNRFYYLQHNQQATYMATNRLSFAFGGNAMAVRRQSSSLAGLNSYGAMGAVSYRMGARDTVALVYDYSNFNYTRLFGDSNIHQLMAQYSRQLSRRWRANVGAGIFRVETRGLISVAPDPAVVALFGSFPVIETFHRQKNYLAAQVSVNGNYRRHNVSFSYSRSPSPGNGVYLTSVSDNASAGIGYTGIRHWAFHAALYAGRYGSVGQRNLGTFTNYGGGAGASYLIGKGVSATFQADARKITIHQTGGYNNLGWRGMIGLAYSPGERPLSLW